MTGAATSSRASVDRPGMRARRLALMALRPGAFDDPDNPEGLRRAGEYSAKQYTVSHMAPARGSLAFAGQVAGLVYESFRPDAEKTA